MAAYFHNTRKARREIISKKEVMILCDLIPERTAHHFFSIVNTRKQVKGKIPGNGDH